MNEVITKEKEIENLIYEVRGKQVILDSDLARLYECANGTKTINQAVRRHLDRFPEDFYFQLTKDEYLNLKSQVGTSSLKEYDNLKFQIETSKLNSYGGVRKMPFVFTEQGVAMLATILRTEVASQISITIMRAFVAMRKYISSNLMEQKYINNLVLEDHEKIKILETSFNKLAEKRKTNEIYFNGQIYDAYSKIQEIFKSATRKLIIIDAYADNTILDIIKRLNVGVVIITKKDNLLTEQDVKKYNKQYHNLKVIYDNTFHDRYFILDNERIYHCGASINKIGYKTFSITLINDNFILKTLTDRVSKIMNN